MSRVVSEEEAILMSNLSYNIRYAIRDKNTNAAAIAKKAGITKSIIYSYTRGRPRIDQDVIERIADALECSVDDLTRDYDTSMPNLAKD